MRYAKIMCMAHDASFWCVFGVFLVCFWCVFGAFLVRMVLYEIARLHDTVIFRQ